MCLGRDGGVTGPGPETFWELSLQWAVDLWLAHFVPGAGILPQQHKCRRDRWGPWCAMGSCSA